MPGSLMLEQSSEGLSQDERREFRFWLRFDPRYLKLAQEARNKHEGEVSFLCLPQDGRSWDLVWSSILPLECLLDDCKLQRRQSSISRNVSCCFFNIVTCYHLQNCIQG